MTTPSLAARHIAHQLRIAARTANEAETNVYLELVSVERDPDRVWAGGDPNLSYDEFLVRYELCDVAAYRAFAAGFALIGGRPELALYVGHEAVTYAAEMASPDQVARVITAAKAHRELHDVVADRATLRRAMGYA